MGAGEYGESSSTARRKTFTCSKAMTTTEAIKGRQPDRNRNQETSADFRAKKTADASSTPNRRPLSAKSVSSPPIGEEVHRERIAPAWRTNMSTQNKRLAICQRGGGTEPDLVPSE